MILLSMSLLTGAARDGDAANAATTALGALSNRRALYAARHGVTFTTGD